MARYVDVEEVQSCVDLTNAFISLKDYYIIPKNAPVADVAPIVHAHWEREDRKYALNKFRCSNCKCASQTDTKQFLTDYCGNCGAKMDGKDGG